MAPAASRQWSPRSQPVRCLWKRGARATGLSSLTLFSHEESQPGVELSRWEIKAINASNPLEGWMCMLHSQTDNTQLVTIARHYKTKAWRVTLFELSARYYSAYLLLSLHTLLSSHSTQRSGFLKTNMLMMCYQAPFLYTGAPCDIIALCWLMNGLMLHVPQTLGAARTHLKCVSNWHNVEFPRKGSTLFTYCLSPSPSIIIIIINFYLYCAFLKLKALAYNTVCDFGMHPKIWSSGVN